MPISQSTFLIAKIGLLTFCGLASFYEAIMTSWELGQVDAIEAVNTTFATLVKQEKKEKWCEKKEDLPIKEGKQEEEDTIESPVSRKKSEHPIKIE